MNYILSYPLKALKGIYSLYGKESSKFGRNWKLFSVKEYANESITKGLLDSKPFMVGRLGATELTCMVNYLGVKFPNLYQSTSGYIKNQTPPWWWNESIKQQMQNYSGFFPVTDNGIEQFCEMMIKELPNVDILGSWLKEESFFKKELQNSKVVVLEDLEPFFTEKPWTWALQGQKVLVIHPFADQIRSQYQNRKNLFANELLPQFDLKTITAVQSLGNEKNPHSSWFEALESMKLQILNTDFDVCILGCGAYGFPLASFIKNQGKKAVHLGGVTQLLFGIKGARWENYIVYPYQNLFNEFWTRPGQVGRIQNINSVEGGCYW